MFVTTTQREVSIDATLIAGWEALCRQLAPPRGRPPKKGKRLATPRQLARRRKGWRTVKAQLYGKQVKRQVLSIMGLWYHVSKDQPIKVLIVRDPAGRQSDDYMFRTEPTVSDVEIIERFAARWPIEESIHDGKQLGGFEQVQGWCAPMVTRQAPLAMLIQTPVKVWYMRWGVKAASMQPRATDWGPIKDHPSYLDMLAPLPRVVWTDRINI